MPYETMNKDKTLNESKNNQTARDKLTITLITISTNRLKTQFAYFYSSLYYRITFIMLYRMNIIILSESRIFTYEPKKMILRNVFAINFLIRSWTERPVVQAQLF